MRYQYNPMNSLLHQKVHFLNLRPMQLEDAIRLIKNEKLMLPNPQTWADLGSGTGTFTRALAHLLAPNSTIYTMDKDKAALNQIPPGIKEVYIEKLVGDFVRDALSLPPLDGILMANSLHYVKDKVALINKLRLCLHEQGCFIIIEYDTDQSNPWVPYPIKFDALLALFNAVGYYSIEKVGEHPSIYRSANIYAALIQ